MSEIKKVSHKRGNGIGSVFYDRTKGKYIAKMPIENRTDATGKVCKRIHIIGSFDTLNEAISALAN